MGEAGRGAEPSMTALAAAENEVASAAGAGHRSLCVWLSTGSNPASLPSQLDDCG